MKFKILTITIALLTTAAPASAATHRHPARLVTPAIFAKVLRVHNCEEPVWNVRGPWYAGGLGWRLATWAAYRLPWMPLSAAQATPQEQALAMTRFVAIANHGWWPDQSHCASY